MKIVVNTRKLFKAEVQDGSHFEYECFKRIAALNLKHEFVFICDRSFKKEFIAQKNITLIVIEKAIKTRNHSAAGTLGWLYSKTRYYRVLARKAEPFA